MEVHAKESLVAFVCQIKRLAIELEQRALLFLCAQITLYDEVTVVMAQLTYWSQWPAADCFRLEQTLLHTRVKWRRGRTCLTCNRASCASIHAGQPQLSAAELCHHICEFTLTRPCFENYCISFCLKLSMRCSILWSNACQLDRQCCIEV